MNLKTIKFKKTENDFQFDYLQGKNFLAIIGAQFRVKNISDSRDKSLNLFQNVKRIHLQILL